jgi:hypothetical protein
MPSLRISFYVGAAISLVAAVLSVMRGSKYVYEIDGQNSNPPTEIPEPENGSDDGMSE